MTFGQLFGQAEFGQMFPPVEASSGTNLVPVDLSSDVPPIVASTGQDCH